MLESTKVPALTRAIEILNLIGRIGPCSAATIIAELGIPKSTVYLLLGAVGMPVFSGFQGGLAKLAGPTGGYLAGFWLMILVAGIIMEKGKRNLLVTILGMLVGVAIDYAVGTAWFVFQTESTVVHALDVCVYPFIPFDVAKIVIAVLLGSVVYKGLQKAKLL